MTTFIDRTVFVFGTFDLETTDLVVLRIAEESFLATTDGLSVDRFADCISAAQDGSVARITAFSLSVTRFQTALTVVTFLVATTTDFLDANAVGADLSADALRVVRASRATFSIDTLLRRKTVSAALAPGDANSARTSLGRRTLGLRGAVNQSHTSLVGASGKTGFAFANSSCTIENELT